MDSYLIILALIVAPAEHLITAEESCEESLKYLQQNDYFSLWRIGSSSFWFNMTTWDGHMQIPQKDNLTSECFSTLGNVLVLTEKYPDIEDINENIVEVQACNLNDDRHCAGNRKVLIRKCNDTLMYNFPSFETTEGDTLLNYICFDRISTETSCRGVMVQPRRDYYDNVLKLTLDNYYGWIDTFIELKQFVVPACVDSFIIFEKCAIFNDHVRQYCLQDPLPNKIGEEPIRLVVCDVRIYDGHYYHQSDGIGKCHDYIYVRSCNGKIKFDLTENYHLKDICLIQQNDLIVQPILDQTDGIIKVQPEIDHEESEIIEDGRELIFFTPSLQYRCSFDIFKDTQYKINWYINGIFQIQMGPSSNLDELSLKEKYLVNLTDGYQVNCGVFPAHENETVESISEAFFAEWKIKNKDTRLSKSGVATVTVEQTVPIGCIYRTDLEATCLDTLSFEDLVPIVNTCNGIKITNSEDPSKSFIEIKSLKKGEKWAKKEYVLQLSTKDNDYDDKTTYDIQLKLARNSNVNIGRPITSKICGAPPLSQSTPKEKSISEIVGALQVKISNIDRHWNKRCYSHVDPHMRTVDGVYYEAQREGDYMLLMNKQYQIEIQTSARYCTPGYTQGPVCACGIAIAVGADTFIINRCHDKPYIKFDLTCNDGGIIDIERIHDYRYLVRTPIGTVIEIFIWGDVMNIDVYMSAKDFGNVVGLCGNFDGDHSNDLKHRDGTFSYDNNRSYKFADSWRLTDEENLFLNPNRKLDHWDNAGYTHSSCDRPKSITRTKCKIKRRRRRSYPERQEMILKKRNQSSLSRQRRSDTIFTEDEAFQLCNSSIYTTSAVKDFSDKVSGEDPDIVVEQCVYDLTQGNDTTWIDAHVSALNNAVDTILMLNPVYVANNTDKVNSFRAKTCLNNCSGNGECAETGLCECGGSYRGPDCSIDITNPPIVYEIEGDGVCTITEDDDCTCFQIRTDSIFDGFVCSVTENKVYFNGTRVDRNTITELGHYEDIFTGECCVSTRINKRSSINVEDTDDISVVMYEFSISNDGDNYGETNSVYLFDTTCLEQLDVNEIVTFKLKDEYCFIDGTCVAESFKVMNSSACFICDPGNDLYNWTKVKCDDSSTHLGTGAIVGIVLGSATFITVAAVLIYIITTKTHTKHSSSIGIQPKKNVFQNMNTTNRDVSRSGLSFSPAKLKFERNVWVSSTPTNLVSDMTRVERDVPTREIDVRHTQIDNYLNADNGHRSCLSDKGKSDKDISLIKLESN